MDEQTLKRKKFIINTLFYGLGIGVFYVSFKYIPAYALPFVIAALFSLLSIRLAKKLQPHIGKRKNGTQSPLEKISWKIASVFSCIIVLFCLLLIVSTIILPILIYAGDLFGKLPEFYENAIGPGLQNLQEGIKDWSGSLGEPLAGLINRWVENSDDNLASIISLASEAVLSWTATQAVSLPSFMLSMIITVIALFFFTIDYQWILQMLKEVFPPKFGEKIESVSKSLFSMIWKFFKSYALIFLITFAEVSVGYLIAGVEQPFLVGLLIAIIDIFPLIGSGMIILPWSIIAFLTGETYQGVVLFIVYLVVVIVREIIEPKIVGQHVGLRPIVSLITIYIGSKLFGVVGLFGLPIAAAIFFETKKKVGQVYEDEPGEAGEGMQKGTGEEAGEKIGDGTPKEGEVKAPEAEITEQSNEIKNS